MWDLPDSLVITVSGTTCWGTGSQRLCCNSGWRGQGKDGRHLQSPPKNFDRSLQGIDGKGEKKRETGAQRLFLRLKKQQRPSDRNQVMGKQHKEKGKPKERIGIIKWELRSRDRGSDGLRTLIRGKQSRKWRWWR